MKKLFSIFILIIYSISSSPFFLIASEIKRAEYEKNALIEQILSYQTNSSQTTLTKAEKLIKAAEGGEVSLGKAKVIFSKNALNKDTIISIEALSNTQQTDETITNKTAFAAGFRFLPSGSFNTEVELHIPYDSSISGNRAALNELKTYFFSDKESGNSTDCCPHHKYHTRK